MRLPRKYSGFTLIEILVTIAIIAILSTAGIIIFQNIQRSARDAKRMADMLAIKKALDQYYLANRTYSTNKLIYDDNFLESYFSGGEVPHDPQKHPVTGYLRVYQNHVCPDSFRVCQQLEDPNAGNAGGNIPVDPNNPGAECRTPIPPGKGFFCIRNSFSP